MSEGIKPGKIMGELLHKGEEWWEDANYAATREDIIKFILTIKN
jgi:hypothetical protein